MNNRLLTLPTGDGIYRHAVVVVDVSSELVMVSGAGYLNSDGGITRPRVGYDDKLILNARSGDE